MRPRWHGAPPSCFSTLQSDSRAVESGDLFCAIPGTKVDGHTFVGSAEQAGAVAAVVERMVDVPLPQLVVTDAHASVAHLASLFVGDPSDDLRLIGITGTNGKSTTVWLVRWILSDESPTAALGTLGTVSIDGELGPATLTTPDPIELVRTLAELRDNGVVSVALEVSSHALDQHRTDGLSFDAIAYTSFSREHLDYHADLESYRTAKLRLTSLLKADGICVVNNDEPAWNGVAPDDTTTLRYGLEPKSDVSVADLSLSADSSKFRLCVPGEDLTLTLPFPAEFNVRNALAATTVALGLGMPLDRIVERLSSAPPVPGRMEVLTREPVLVIRDYAHNPDSCERALSTLREIVSGRVIALLGCGGDRDAGKRPIMGQILTRLADTAIVTSDNPRSEDPEEICRQMVNGLDPSSYTIVLDRYEAIEYAIAEAGQFDAVILLGKGHETYQIVGDEYRTFDEARIVAEILDGSGMSA